MERPSKDDNSGSSINLSSDSQEKEKNTWKLPSKDASLFSTSLPVILHGKVNVRESGLTDHLRNDDFPSLSKIHVDDQSKDPLEDIDPITIGSFLPGDEDELLAGLMDDFDLSATQIGELDDDLFGSGGGIEIDHPGSQDNLVYGMSRLSTSDGISGISSPRYGFMNGVGTVSGEHPYGEHPSRTLFVRNINSNVEDSELLSLFEQYGDIRTLYTACKHRGFVMIAYYDIRAARNAMRGLQGKPLRRRKLDIHFSIPKDNPSEKDINQGTLVVFNLDPSVSSDELRLIFGAYGQVKEIRETPHKHHHKFIEFYDVRAAEAALKALNRSDIAGKRIKVEHSRPGGTRRSFMQQLIQDPELDEARALHHQVGSPISSPPSSFATGSWPNFGSPLDHHSLHSYNQTSPNLASLSPVGSNPSPGLTSLLSHQMLNPVKVAPIGTSSRKLNHVINQGVAFQNHFSLPKHSYVTSSPGSMSPFADHEPDMLSGPEFLWGSPKVSSEQIIASSWSPSLNVRQNQPSVRDIGFPYASRHGPFLGQNLHVGSAPSGIQMARHVGFYPGSVDISSVRSSTFGVTDFNRNNGSRAMNISSPGGMSTGLTYGGSFTESSSSPSPRMMSMSQNVPIYFGNGTFGSVGSEGMIELGRIRRQDYSIQLDEKKQYQLDMEKIRNGEDNRTTLMIKNIPNKYTSKMLLLAIDETHKGTYDFLYLPIDFKNKCNVGYAFINMISPSHIITFYEAFNGKKWENFNSEKVVSLAYARIQGKSSLVAHFQNSSLMNEDKRCRPILFRSSGQDSSDLEHLPCGNLNIFTLRPDGSYVGDSLDNEPDYML